MGHLICHLWFCLCHVATLEKGLTEHRNMHYGPKEAPLALIWSPAEVHRSWMWQRCHWVTLLCNSGDPLSAAGEAERAASRASRTDVANSSLLWGGSRSGMTCWSVPACQPGPWPPPCWRASHHHGALHLTIAWAHLSEFLVSTTVKFFPVTLLEYHKMGEILAVNSLADSFLSFLIFYLWGRGHTNNWRCLFAPTAICESFAM